MNVRTRVRQQPDAAASAPRRSGHAPLWVMAILLAGLVGQLAFPGSEFDGLIDGVYGVMATSAPLVVCWLVLYRTGLRRLDVLLATAAVTSFSAANVYYAFVQALVGTVPFPSPADIGYLLFYPLMLGALAVLVRTPAARHLGRAVWLDTASWARSAQRRCWRSCSARCSTRPSQGPLVTRRRSSRSPSPVSTCCSSPPWSGSRRARRSTSDAMGAAARGPAGLRRHRRRCTRSRSPRRRTSSARHSTRAGRWGSGWWRCGSTARRAQARPPSRRDGQAQPALAVPGAGDGSRTGRAGARHAGAAVCACGRRWPA